MHCPRSSLRLRALHRASLAITLAAVLLTVAQRADARIVSAADAGGQPVAIDGLSGAGGSLRAEARFGDVEYLGGPVMTSNTDYVVVWAPSNYAGAPYQPGYAAGVGRFFTDLSAASASFAAPDAVASQYTDGQGNSAAFAVSFGGTLTDGDPLPASGCHTSGVYCLTDAQIQAELSHFLTASGVPRDLAHESFMLLPPSVVACLDATGSQCSGNAAVNRDFCAYHSRTADGYLFAAIPDVGGVVGCDPFVTFCPASACGYDNGAADGVLSQISHEHLESVTDPLPGTAWVDYASNSEIADKCNDDAFADPNLQLGSDGAGHDTPYNTTLNGDHYLLQLEWSNAGHQCVNGFASGTSATAAGFVETSTGGLTVNFDASASTVSSGPAEYVWEFNDGPGPTATIETTNPQISHTFPYGGAYHVALTVLGADGTTGAAAATFVVGGASAPVPRFAFAPAPAAVGQTVAFDAGASTDGTAAAALTSYTWSFGDGASASGAQVSHAYARPGIFPVTLTVTDAAGMSNTVARIVTVTAPPPVVIAPVTTSSAPAASGSSAAALATHRAVTASAARASACVVPRLRAHSLATTRRALARAHCRLGRVRRPRHAPHRGAGRHRRWALIVVRQSLGWGHHERKNTAVGVTVAYRAVKAR